MARIWTLRCSGIQLTRYGQSGVMHQCVVVLVRAPLYALCNAALLHAVGSPAGTPLGIEIPSDPRWSDRQIVRSSDREIEIPWGHDPRHPRWSNTPHGGVKVPSICICPRANEWVQQPGHKGIGPYSCCLGVVLLLGLKPRASHG